MNPKKISKLYTVVSEDLNLKADLVEDLIEYYYKDIRKMLTNLEYPRINIDGLGQFVVKPKTVSNTIERISKSLNNHDVSTFKAYHHKKAMENKLELLLKLCSKLELVNNKKEDFLKNKYNEERT
jgi:nucleoid DNA-binding protein